MSIRPNSSIVRSTMRTMSSSCFTSVRTGTHRRPVASRIDSRDLLQFRFRPARDHQVGAVLGEQARGRGADAGAAAGDDRGAVGEVEGIRGHRLQTVGSSVRSTSSPAISRPTRPMSK